MSNRVKPFKLMLLITVLTAFAACTKPKFEGDACIENCYILEGVLLDTPYHNPVAGAEVNLRYWSNQSSWNKWVASAKTDKGGYWKMSFDADYFAVPSENARLRFDTPFCFEGSKSIDLDTSMIDAVQTFEQRLFRKTNLGVWIRSSSQKNFTQFNIRAEWGGANQTYAFNTSGPMDTIVYIPVAADIPTTITGFSLGGDYYKETHVVTVPLKTPKMIPFFFE